MWDRQKAIETILYLANRVSEPTVLRILKLLYLADKLHLSRHGRFILRDRYVAMAFGPVASNTYDLMKEPAIGDFVVIDKKEVAPCRDADVIAFSRTDQECLDEIIAVHGRASTERLIDIAHDQVWKDITDRGKRVKKDAPGPKSLPMPIECIADDLPNAAEVREQLRYLERQGYPQPK